MTNATRKTLIDVYGTLVRAGWGEPDDQGAEPTVPDHETAERPSAVRQPIEGESAASTAILQPTTPLEE